MYLEDTLKQIQFCLQEIQKRLDGFEKKESKEILDNQDVMQLLNISPRTLQNYRNQGVIPYSKIEGKIYYKMKDIRTLIEKNYSKSFHF